MISDVKVQHAGIYVCRATIPGTRNFTVAMATLTVLGKPASIFSVFEHLVSVFELCCVLGWRFVSNIVHQGL